MGEITVTKGGFSTQWCDLGGEALRGKGYKSGKSKKSFT